MQSDPSVWGWTMQGNPNSSVKGQVISRAMNMLADFNIYIHTEMNIHHVFGVLCDQCVSHLGLLCESFDPNHPLCFSSVQAGACSDSSFEWLCPFPAHSLFPWENKFLLCFFPWLSDSVVEAALGGAACPKCSPCSPSMGPLCCKAATMAAFSSSPGLSKDQRRPSPTGPLRRSVEGRGRFCRDMDRGKDFCSPKPKEPAGFPEPGPRGWTL